MIAWSDWARASLLDDYGLDPERVVKIPGGVEVPPQTPRNPHDGPVRLLFVAFDFEAKGGSELLAALEGLKGWELDVVTHSPVEADGRLRVHRGVIPRSPELADLYSHADAVVLPSRGDASPFVVLESMAASLPIITTRFGAIGEIDAEGTGLLVPPRDVGALSAALQRILTDAELRKRLGEAVRARVISHYRADRNGNRMLDVLVAAALDTAHGSTVSPRRSTLPGRPIGETPMGQAWRR